MMVVDVVLDLLESILGVLLQLTEKGNFKLVSDKQQLGRHSQRKMMKDTEEEEEDCDMRAF